MAEARVNENECPRGSSCQETELSQPQEIVTNPSVEGGKPPTGGLKRLLACCGILKAPVAEEDNRKSLDTSGHSSHQGCLKSKYEEAVSSLLRGESSPTDKTFTRVRHIRQIESWDCGT